MFKIKLGVFILSAIAVVGTSHAAHWTLLHCDHWPGSSNSSFKSWTTMFMSNDTASLNNAIRACQNNKGSIAVTSYSG